MKRLELYELIIFQAQPKRVYILLLLLVFCVSPQLLLLLLLLASTRLLFINESLYSYIYTGQKSASDVQGERLGNKSCHLVFLSFSFERVTLYYIYYKSNAITCQRLSLSPSSVLNAN